ncbi:lipopolysaccharide biosynthesis protein [Bifidobacterium sp.]|jgi:PST family polysaccharide transporter|uniref:lipopolysaccharide biosynthesis protein n=1 Tax=Bifidobacterium sp. TaxID=41200 RepID=UPI0025C654FC|nr:lipopolysaccharide biosynthesis protein [Bifidobacterium sp.]MCI1634769.1 lipopolysaccharide biosynthesis protein [Bifidobacterium sp.]
MNDFPGKSKRTEINFRKAAILQFASRYANVILQLVLTAILARLLTPNEYGVMAGVAIFTNLFGILGDMGLGPAIIQYKQLTKSDYGGLFVFSIILGIVLSVVFVALGFPISQFFNEPSYVSLCAWSAVSILFGTMNMVPNGILLKKKRFDIIGIRLIITTVIGGIVAIILAVMGAGTMALVWNINIVSISIFIWNVVSIKDEINLTDIVIIKPLKLVAKYSVYQAGFGIVNYFSRNLDHLIIGKVFGSVALGLYDKSYKLTSYPIQFIPGVLGSILQPYLAKYENDREKIYQVQMKLIFLLSSLGVVISFAFILCGKEIIYFFYGSQWLSSVPLFVILCASITFQMVNNITGGILQSAGRTDYLFRQGVVATTTMLGMLLIGSFTHDLNKLTAFITIGFVLQTISVAYYTTVKAFGHSIIEFFKPIVSALCPAVIIFIPLAVLKFHYMILAEHFLLSLLVFGLTFVAAYCLWLFCTGKMSIFASLWKSKSV